MLREAGSRICVAGPDRTGPGLAEPEEELEEGGGVFGAKKGGTGLGLWEQQRGVQGGTKAPEGGDGVG